MLGWLSFTLYTQFIAVSEELMRHGASVLINHYLKNKKYIFFSYLSWDCNHHFGVRFFMMDKLHFSRLPQNWPAQWGTPNTLVLMRRLSGSLLGFNKIINLYLLSSGHNRNGKKKKTNNSGLFIYFCFFFFNLTDAPADKVMFGSLFAFLNCYSVLLTHRQRLNAGDMREAVI